MESLHKNIQLILDFLKAPFLVLKFSYYTLMTFLMTLSVIFLSMLMILLSIWSVIRHLICGNFIWLVNLNLIYETLWSGVRSDLLISILGKLHWFCLTGLITMVLLMRKMDGSVLAEQSYFKMLGFRFSSKLDWDSYIISIAKTTSKKIIALFYEVSFS